MSCKLVPDLTGRTETGCHHSVKPEHAPLPPQEPPNSKLEPDELSLLGFKRYNIFNF